MSTPIGSKIKALRLSKKITQEELSGSFMSRVVLSRIENNKTLPSISQIQYISQRLEVNIDCLLSSINYNSDISDTYAPYTDSVLEELYNKKMYYNIVKLQDNTSEETGNSDEKCKDYYTGMSYFNLDLPFQAIKPLRRYMNIYLRTEYTVQKENILKFLDTLNTLFKIMMKNKNYSKCEVYLSTAVKFINKYYVESPGISFKIHSNLASLYLKQCRYEDIINILVPFLDNHKEFQYIYIAANMYLTLSIACYNLDQCQKSIIYIKKAICLFSYLEKYQDTGECYFNYINALRHSENYIESDIILGRCLQDYRNESSLYDRYLVLKAVLLFNEGRFDDVFKIMKEVDTNNLSRNSRHNLYFILGHINYLNSNYSRALRFLTKCEKHFRNQNFIDDLSVLYNDLYTITGGKEYCTAAQECLTAGIKRKNIIVNLNKNHPNAG